MSISAPEAALDGGATAAGVLLQPPKTTMTAPAEASAVRVLCLLAGNSNVQHNLEFEK